MVASGFSDFTFLNKIDLPQADPSIVIKEIEEIIGIEASNAIEVSAKNGTGLDALLTRIVEKVPSPQGDISSPLSALILIRGLMNIWALYLW